MAMPPPYWRTGGAVFHVLRSLQHLVDHLDELIPLNLETEERLDEYLSRSPEPEDDDPEFGEICSDLWDLEHEVKLDTDIAVFMAAISSEDELNRFCVYNMHRDIAEPLEKLSPPEKLQVASAIVGHPGVKGQHSFAAIQRLTTWRNAFAHGHCVDRPTKSLRHNHLISPSDYPGVPDSIAACIKYVRGYLVLSRYMRSISKNPYTGGGSEEDKEIEAQLRLLERYKFEGTPSVYTIIFEG